MNESKVQPDNQLILCGRMVGSPQTRITPAGIPISRFTLEHESVQQESGSAKKVKCRIRVVTCGDDLQASLKELTETTLIKVTGFISYESSRGDETRLVLHAENILKLN